MTQISDQPFMSEAEIALLKKWLPPAARVLEFGAGSSSKFFFAQGASLLASVESDLAFLETLAEDPMVGFFHRKNKWLPLHADIGKTGFLGYPLEVENGHLALNYHHAIWEKLEEFFPPRPERKVGANAPDLDFVLVDGRFRVACFCQTLIHCRAEKLPFFFHDFWDRPHYHSVLEFTEVQDQADTAAILFPRKKTDWRKVQETLLASQFNPN